MEIDIHAARGDESVHVLTMHRGDKDNGPLQMVSPEQVKAWMQKEVDYDALMARLEGVEKPGNPV
jgi:hypothetical protein